MNLQLSITGKGDVTRQMYRQLRERILDGRLRAGERLPPSRELAHELNVARKTVTNVYDLLAGEGFLETRVGSGTFVASIPLRKTSAIASRIAIPSQWDRLSRQLNASRERVPYDFSVGVPDVSRFPFPLWRSILASQARLITKSGESIANPAGHAGLREAISRYTGFTRAVVCQPDVVVVTNGAQHALSLIASVLRPPTVAMEHPGYTRAQWLFEMHGARVVEVPVDEEGLIVDKIPPNATLVYVTPSHQFPTGVCMSLQRRLALLDWAAKHKAAIVEDDYDSEFRFAPRPLESLQSLDRNGVVLYVGTFSKVLYPALRLGFVIAPAPLRPALLAARELTDWHGPTILQATLAKFIRDGHLTRHIRKMRRLYAARRLTLLDSLHAHLSKYTTPYPSMAGLHIAVRLTRSISADALAARALNEGVRVESLGAHGVAFGYGAIEQNKIDEGIRRLKKILSLSLR